MCERRGGRSVQDVSIYRIHRAMAGIFKTLGCRIERHGAAVVRAIRRERLEPAAGIDQPAHPGRLAGRVESTAVDHHESLAGGAMNPSAWPVAKLDIGALR